MFLPALNRDKIAISVIDSGIGIQKKERANLFKLSGCGSKEAKGLGLVISNQLVNLFGGTLGVQSTYKKGSCFAFSMLLGYEDLN